LAGIYNGPRLHAGPFSFFIHSPVLAGEHDNQGGGGPMTAKYLLLIQIAATWGMVGVIWFAQLSHYPLLGLIGRGEFVRYQEANMARTGRVVVPLMLLEAATALFLLWRRPAGVPVMLLWLGVGLIVVNWGSTFFLQVPKHEILKRGFDPRAHRGLIRTNWIRTAAWTCRGFLVLWMAAGLL
jgi:hypothetical protein